MLELQIPDPSTILCCARSVDMQGCRIHMGSYRLVLLEMHYWLAAEINASSLSCINTKTCA
jgi:hypothetical protein